MHKIFPAIFIAFVLIFTGSAISAAAPIFTDLQHQADQLTTDLQQLADTSGQLDRQMAEFRAGTQHYADGATRVVGQLDAVAADAARLRSDLPLLAQSQGQALNSSLEAHTAIGSAQSVCDALASTPQACPPEVVQNLQVAARSTDSAVLYESITAAQLRDLADADPGGRIVAQTDALRLYLEGPATVAAEAARLSGGVSGVAASAASASVAAADLAARIATETPATPVPSADSPAPAAGAGESATPPAVAADPSPVVLAAPLVDAAPVEVVRELVPVPVGTSSDVLASSDVPAGVPAPSPVLGWWAWLSVVTAAGVALLLWLRVRA